MAKKDFILQGLTPRTHTEAIKRLFDVVGIEQVILSVAFINEDGVRLIEDNLRLIAKKTKVFSGIRNDITSHQGLARLMDIGVSLFTVDTGARNVVFHPKLYFVKGETEARLVIGSANLTLGGMNNNIEASVAIDFDLNEPKDREFVKGMEDQFSELLTKDPEHIFQIKTLTDLDKLKINGRLIDESEALPPRPAVSASAPSNDPISRIHLDVKPLRRSVNRVSTEQIVHPRIGEQNESEVFSKKHSLTNLKLIWESKALTERDLNIPQATGTNPTGSINLDKGQLEDIDQRHYFRDVVFAHLKWSPRSADIEEAEARFQLVVKGIFYGEFTLPIRHTTSTTSSSYQQHNAMTRLSWGPMKEFVGQRDLIGRSLSLYRSETEPVLFVLEID